MRTILVLSALLVLSACVGQLSGYSAPYPAPQPFAVEVPADAPSLSQQFAPARHHLGTDFVAEPGRPVLAAAPGRVSAAYFGPAYGHGVEIDHGTDEAGRPITTRYLHLGRRLAVAGDTVARGDPIGTLGRSGALAGGIAHLHFEVWIGPLTDRRAPVDPNRLWADGVGRVTCFEPGRTVPERPFRITHPVACR